MDKFATLEPVRLYTSAGARLLSRSNHSKVPQSPQLVGRLPPDLHLLILHHLPIPDFPAYSRCSRAAAAFVKDDKIWERRWAALEVDKHGFGAVVDGLEAKSRGQVTALRAAAPPTIPVDDDFGDFASVDVVSAPLDEMGDFVGAFDNLNMPNSPRTPATPTFKKTSYMSMFVRVHMLLRPLTRILTSEAHVILTELGNFLSSSLYQEASALHLLSLYLSPHVQPVRQWRTLYSSLRSAMDRFDANLLAAFDLADSKADEPKMREAAESSWEVWDGTGDWEMGKVWAEKREIFYEQGRWKPMDNFTCVNQTDLVVDHTHVVGQGGWQSRFRCYGRIHNCYTGIYN